MDFFAVCAANATDLEKDFDRALSGRPDDERNKLNTFASIVQREGRISINMRPTSLLDFLASDRMFNIYEWADHVVRKSRKTKEEILEEKLKDFYEKRMIFDHHFDRGEEFYYGCLNIGGLGTDRYGEYCVILHQASVCAEYEIGYLQGDSLRTYVSDDPVIDEAKLQSECATESHKHLLATIKHEGEILHADENQWPSILCNHDEYMEAIYIGEVLPAHIETVRISKIDYELYWDYAYNEFREKLGELDRYRVDTFSRIDEYLESIGKGWETVEDA